MSVVLSLVGLVLMLMGITGFYWPDGMVEAQERYPIGPTEEIDSEMRRQVVRLSGLLVAGIGAVLVLVAYF